jgi:tetratricopeptide (TPR) repeat protein
VCAIVGDAGVGKSRLLREFTSSHRFNAWRILESASVSYGRTTSYLSVIDLLKGYFHIQDQDDVRDIREKVTGTVLTLDDTLKPILPALLTLLGVPTNDTDWSALDPVQRRQRTIEAVTRVWLQESRVQPLLIVLEDLHWIDAETQDVLDSLVESLPASRVLLLINYRPEYRHGWGNKGYCTQLRLDALPAASAAELLHALVGDDGSLDGLKQILIARTGSNPFFLEESVRALVETGALVGDRGAYRQPRPIDAMQVPASVQALLAARIDRLSPQDKRLLQAAAVVGMDVPQTLLEAIADTSDGTFSSGLAHLLEADFLRKSSLFPAHEYAFKHALTHEVAYSSLLHDRRRALHLKVLDALEGASESTTRRDIDQLARHALGGDAWRKAATYLRQAGRRAIAQSAYPAAALQLEQALRALEQLPESPEVLAEAIDLRLDLRVALIPLQRYDEALTLMREAEVVATKLGDSARLGWVLAYLCARLRNVLGEHRHAAEVGRRALAIAVERSDRKLEREATYRSGQAYYALGDYRQAMDLFSRTAHSDDAGSSQDPSSPLFASWSHAWLAMALANVGRFVEASSHAIEAIRIAEAADHPFTMVEALTACGGVSLAQGELIQAMEMLERALALARDWKFRSWATLSRLGYAYALSERPAEARAILEEVARSQTTLSSMGLGRALQLAWLAETYARNGQFDQASERGQEALSLARQHEERGHEAWAQRILGEIASRRPGLTDARLAEDHYRRALTIATELGLRPLVAHCQLGLGALYRHIGQHGPSAECLSMASTMYREMGMASWLVQADGDT